MLRPPHRLAPFVLAVALAACDTGATGNQRAFEDAAFFSVPSGITATTADGETTATDAGDWQIGPFFLGTAQIVQVPYPNPARSSDTVTLSVYTDGLPGGMSLYRLDERGDLRLIEAEPRAQQTGIYLFSFFGSQVASAGVPGTYRLVLLDGRDRVVSYGDVQLAP